MNRDTQAAWKYHDETKHSWESVRTNLHYLDWSNLPMPFKTYQDRPSIALPGPEPMDSYPAVGAIGDSDVDLNTGKALALADLSQILHYSAGITHERPSSEGRITFRAAACAGARYPIEVYLVCGDLDGLAAGVYHFNPRDHALVPLREGDYRPALNHAAGGLPEVAAASVVLVFTAISWRSAWKYRSRAYRYHYWDNGTICANALAVSSALNLPAKLVMGFVDSEISEIVGIDGLRELPLSLVAIGSRRGASDAPSQELVRDLPELKFETAPLSGCEVEYPLIRYMHFESSLADSEEVREWRGEPSVRSGFAAPAWTEPAEGQVCLVTLRPQSVNTLPADGIGPVILRRASTRRFALKPISFEELSTVIERSTRGIASDFAPRDVLLNEVYVIATRVEGLSPGAYFYQRDQKGLSLLKEGDFSREGCYLTLEQDLGGDSSATLFYMTDLDRVLSRLGNRGYRAAQMEAGIVGGKVYIAAYALGR